jgi:hypothetical protein
MAELLRTGQQRAGICTYEELCVSSYGVFDFGWEMEAKGRIYLATYTEIFYPTVSRFPQSWGNQLIPKPRFLFYFSVLLSNKLVTFNKLYMSIPFTICRLFLICECLDL